MPAADVRVNARVLVSIALLMVASATACGARAQEAYPSRPVKIIAPQAPGGGVDLVARIIADRLHTAMGLIALQITDERAVKARVARVQGNLRQRCGGMRCDCDRDKVHPERDAGRDTDGVRGDVKDFLDDPFVADGS